MTLRSFFVLLAAGWTLINLSVAQAETPANQKLYQIDLIAYTTINPNSIASEQWPSISPTMLLQAKTMPPNYSDQLSSIDYQLTAPEQRNLTTIEKRLQSNPNFHVIAHFSWRENVPNAQKSFPIYLFAGSVYDSSGNAVSQNTEGQAPASGQTQQLQGTITLDVNRYFNARFNLFLTMPTSSLPSLQSGSLISNDGLTTFHLLQTRRTRSNELNYIDHPLMGMVFMIKKIT